MMDLESLLNSNKDQIIEQEFFSPTKVLTEPRDELEFEALFPLQLAIPEDEDWSVAQREDKIWGPILKWIEKGILPRNNDIARKTLFSADKYGINPHNRLLYRVSESKNEPNHVHLLRSCVPLK